MSGDSGPPAGRVLATLTDRAFDVAVLGAGGAGMAAAVFAALDGLRVILIERTEYLGGTTAYSGGTTWVPMTRHSAAVGASDSRAAASRFLDLAVGNRAPKAMREAFLDAGPAAIETLETRTQMTFRGRPFHPDYLSELEGSTPCGRAIEPEPFEAAGLGADFALIRPPIPEFTVFNGLMVDRDDIAQLLKMTRSPRAALYATRLFGRYLVERLRWPRGTRLVMGNAMIGRLLASARALGVTIATEAETTAFVTENGRVTGLDVTQGAQSIRLTARRGVILAGGGFARHPGLCAALLPQPVPEASPAAPGHTGRLHDLAFGLGARHVDTHDQPCFWAPVSTRARPDGTTAVFPHFVFDRAKPGTVAVGHDGRRFVNESTSYHLFGKAMFEANRAGSTIPCFLIADATAMKAYGLGMVRPGGYGLTRALADGYVVSGRTIAELAGKLGIDAAALAATVVEMNGFAKTGIDTAFGRGSTVYQRANGDASHGPNPTLGPIAAAPFYAVRLTPGDIGASVGLVTDTRARVLGADDAPIPGLYAIGNEAASIMGGTYPGPGITLGPALTFAYIAARDAAAPAETEETIHAA